MVELNANPHFILGRIQGIIRMLDEPAYRLTKDRAIEILREIMTDHDKAVAEPRGLDMIPEARL